LIVSIRWLKDGFLTCLHPRRIVLTRKGGQSVSRYIVGSITRHAISCAFDAKRHVLSVT
jgi:hypothetical protein